MTFKPGDVLSYIPAHHHCREGTAFVTEAGRAVDTFWQSDYVGGTGYAHYLRDNELATATLRFNVNDYRALDIYSKSSHVEWMTYNPDDRGRISSQHGLQDALFLRLGAQPDLGTQIENAREALATAESEMRTAEWRVERRRQDLAELEASRVSA